MQGVPYGSLDSSQQSIGMQKGAAMSQQSTGMQQGPAMYQVQHAPPMNAANMYQVPHVCSSHSALIALYLATLFKCRHLMTCIRHVSGASVCSSYGYGSIRHVPGANVCRSNASPGCPRVYVLPRSPAVDFDGSHEVGM